MYENKVHSNKSESLKYWLNLVLIHLTVIICENQNIPLHIYPKVTSLKLYGLIDIVFQMRVYIYIKYIVKQLSIFIYLYLALTCSWWCSGASGPGRPRPPARGSIGRRAGGGAARRKLRRSGEHRDRDQRGACRHHSSVDMHIWSWDHITQI